MASFSGPKLSNRIADDVPDIQAVLSSLAKLTPDSGNTDYPIGTKRVAETTNGYEFQQYNGTGWVTLEKWNLDAQKVDGYSASTGTTANTIPVRNANGKLPGDILGNAATATKANALSETNPIPMGGTGATTAEQARANLGTPPKTHASTSTEYGTGTSTQYGHLKSHDEPDATLTAATGHAFSPAGAASMKTELEEQIEEVETEASTQVSSLDTSLRALIAAEVAKCLKLSGGTMTGDGAIIFDKAGNVTALSGKQDGTTRLTISAGGTNCGLINILGALYDSNAAGGVQIVGRDSNGELVILNVSKYGVDVNGAHVLTELGGSLSGGFIGPNSGTFRALMTGANGKGRLMITGDKDLKGAFLNLYGGTFDGGGLDGGFQLVATRDGQTYNILQGDPANGLSWNASKVLTANDYWSAIANPNTVLTVPAGGTWWVTRFQSKGDVLEMASFLTAGGSAVTVANSNTQCLWGVRIGN